MTPLTQTKSTLFQLFTVIEFLNDSCDRLLALKYVATLEQYLEWLRHAPSDATKAQIEELVVSIQSSLATFYPLSELDVLIENIENEFKLVNEAETLRHKQRRSSFQSLALRQTSTSIREGPPSVPADAMSFETRYKALTLETAQWEKAQKQLPNRRQGNAPLLSILNEAPCTTSSKLSEAINDNYRGELLLREGVSRFNCLRTPYILEDEVLKQLENECTVSDRQRLFNEYLHVLGQPPEDVLLAAAYEADFLKVDKILRCAQGFAKTSLQQPLALLDINIINNAMKHSEAEWTPLMAEIKTGSIPTVRYLLYCGIDLGVVTPRGTALSVAVECLSEEMIQLLLDSGADMSEAVSIITTQLPSRFRNGRLRSQAICLLAKVYRSSVDNSSESRKRQIKKQLLHGVFATEYALVSEASQLLSTPIYPSKRLTWAVGIQKQTPKAWVASIEATRLLVIGSAPIAHQFAVIDIIMFLVIVRSMCAIEGVPNVNEKSETSLFTALLKTCQTLFGMHDGKRDAFLEAAWVIWNVPLEKLDDGLNEFEALDQIQHLAARILINDLPVLLEIKNRADRRPVMVQNRVQGWRSRPILPTFFADAMVYILTSLVIKTSQDLVLFLNGYPTWPSFHDQYGSMHSSTFRHISFWMASPFREEKLREIVFAEKCGTDTGPIFIFTSLISWLGENWERFISDDPFFSRDKPYLQAICANWDWTCDVGRYCFSGDYRYKTARTLSSPIPRYMSPFPQPVVQIPPNQTGDALRATTIFSEANYGDGMCSERRLPSSPPQMLSGVQHPEYPFDISLAPILTQPSSPSPSATTTPYARTFCKDCKKDFKKLCNYNKHRRDKHEKTRYPCRIAGCSKHFSRDNYRKIHEQSGHQARGGVEDHEDVWETNTFGAFL